MQRVLGLLCLGLLFVGCKGGDRRPLDLAIGTADRDRVELTPSTAIVEYTELPGSKNELRIQLANYEASCTEFVPPSDGQALLTVTVVTPPGERPAVGEYPWTGATPAGVAASRVAIPSARIGDRSMVLPAGGTIRLTEVELTPHGHVDGILAFEFPGDEKRQAASARGAFSAKMCRYNASDSK